MDFRIGNSSYFQALPHLSVSLTKDQTVSYAIQLSSNYVYGTSVSVEGFNHEGVSLFSKSIYTGSAGNVVTAMLPAGIGHLDPYRGTAHAVGRPSYLVVKSLWAQVNYSVFETKNERDGYNQGGLSRAQAKQISVFETVRGNAHWIEGNDLAPGDGTEPGGQWFKVTLEPRQTIRAEGTVLGHSYYGAAFTIQLCDESGSYLATLAGISAYGNVPFPTTQAPGSYLYQNTASEPKTFYLQVYSKVGIVHDYEFSLVEIMMQFEASPPTINISNGYSEDRTIHMQAVRGDTYAPLTSFADVVAIREVGTETIYDKNWGSLPANVSIQPGAGGNATFLVQSRVGPRENKGVNQRWPVDAKIIAVGFRMPGRDYLEIPQWVCTEFPKKIHDLSSGCVPDWMQRRVRDIFDRTDLTDADRAALNAIESYSVADLGLSVLGGVAYKTMRAPKVPIILNPTASNAMRLDGQDSKSVCGQAGTFHLLRRALFHEARHAYQGSIASANTTDVDEDLLVNTPYPHNPSNAVLDSTDERQVCDPNADIQDQLSAPKNTWKYHGDHGDSSRDSILDPHYAVWGLEMDAYEFGAIVREW